MSAEPRVELLRRAYEAVARGDVEAALEPFDSSVVVQDHDRTLETTTQYHGPQGLLELFSAVNEGFEDVRYTPTSFDVRGDRVLVDLLRTGRGAASGVEVSERQFHLFEFAGDRIVRLRAFVDRGQAREAAGMSD